MTDEMKRYVVGFLFNEVESGVVLLRKQSPDWQAGKLNGIGGHVEPGESFMDAMVREGKEEAGSDQFDWHQFATLRGDGFVMGCFRGYFLGSYAFPKTNDVGEYLELHSVVDVSVGRVTTIPNLRWLVPMATKGARWGWPYVITESAPTTDEKVNEG